MNQFAVGYLVRSCRSRESEPDMRIILCPVLAVSSRGDVMGMGSALSRLDSGGAIIIPRPASIGRVLFVRLHQV